MIIVPSTPICLNFRVCLRKRKVMKHSPNMSFSIVNDFFEMIFLIIFYLLGCSIINLSCKEFSSCNFDKALTFFSLHLGIIIHLRKFIHPDITNIDSYLSLSVKVILFFRNIEGFICTTIHVITALSLIELSFVFFFSLWPSSSIENLWSFIFC